jgi:hypothetical protein
MSGKEVSRLEVVRQLQSKAINQVQAGQLLGLSVRQVKRLCRQVREQGPQGLVSRKRGRPSNRRIDDVQRAHYVALVRKHYADFGPQLAHEYLARDHGFGWSVETLRSWMMAAGLWQAKRRRAQRVHSPRARRACLGELVQIDGSHHDWFEGRSAKCCLIAFIDDATGRVLGARFFEQETTQGYLQVLQALVQRRGAPLALYSDRHGIFTKPNPEDTKPTQFERALLQLDIEPICAHSPQAKGRVERLFQTLQDRLCKAMRLQGIDTLEQANTWLDEYLRQHNQRFAVEPAQTLDMHRPWHGTEQALANICALHHQRQLSAQGACKFEGSIVQLQPGQAHAPKARAMIDIAQHRDGSLHLSYRGQALSYRRYTPRECAPKPPAEDHKTLNQRVDKARDAKLTKLQKLKAEIAFQNSQRQQGIYRPDTPPIVPRRSPVRPTPDRTKAATPPP